jgi:hypothetical protein
MVVNGINQNSASYLPFKTYLHHEYAKSWYSDHPGIDWLFTVLRPAQEFFTYMETSLLPVKG